MLKMLSRKATLIPFLKDPSYNSRLFVILLLTPVLSITLNRHLKEAHKASGLLPFSVSASAAASWDSR
jgi:hypothetical protein